MDYVGKLSVFTTVLIRGRQRFREERRYPAVAFEDEGRSQEPGKVLLSGVWDLPRPRLEPVSPALADRFSTTGPPGTSQYLHFRFLTSKTMAE